MWKLLRHYGVPRVDISLIRCTYQDMSCRIAHAGQLSESFEVKTGVRQGCQLSPFLFLLVIDWIMQITTTGTNNDIQWTIWMQLDDLNFADDLALLSHNHSQMQDMTTLLETTSAGTGLKINKKKTELMKMNTTANTLVFHHAQKHLGIWRNQHENQTPHLQLQCEVNPALSSTDVTWRTRQTMQQKIQTFFNTCLRCIYKIRRQKIRNDLWERAGQILRRKWGWIGHTLRKPASSTTR